MEHIINVLEVEQLTHDVKRFTCTRPEGYSFTPGQATDLAINQEGWREEKRPFTFTGLSDAPCLEFVIKIYSDHAGMTRELDSLRPGDELIIGDAWGAIEYKGPGYFIAGGAGITPFIAIFRDLKRGHLLEGNRLFFSNKTDRDIILREGLAKLLNGSAVFTVTDEPSAGYLNGFIDEDFLKRRVADFSRHFYLCGPPAMVRAIKDILGRLGASPYAVVLEK